MDDDTITFFLVFIAMWVAILLSTSAYIGAFNVLKPKAGVVLLQSQDLEHKLIIVNPIVINSSFSYGSVDYIFYIYNDKSFNQSITFSWHLSKGMMEEASYIVFYSSLGQNTTISSGQVLECYVRFSIADGAPQNIVDRITGLRPAVILYVNAELLK